MEPTVQPIFISQGASWRLRAILQGPGSLADPPVPRDLTGCEARMEIRPKAGSPTLWVSVNEIPDPDGSIVIGGADGTIDIFLSASGTNKITKEVAAYDLFLEWPNGQDVWKVLKGAVTCDLAVTEPTYDV